MRLAVFVSDCCQNKYVIGTDIYPHMPILRPHAARISSVTFTSAHLYGTIDKTSL